MATSDSYTDIELVVRMEAPTFFSELPATIEDEDDRALLEPLLRRSAYIIAYQAVYAQIYLAVAPRLGKLYGQPIGHAAAWKYCLDSLAGHPLHVEFVDTVKNATRFRVAAVYETSSFDWSFREIELMIGELELLLGEFVKIHLATPGP
jgi:hypothetical protein